MTPRTTLGTRVSEGGIFTLAVLTRAKSISGIMSSEDNHKHAYEEDNHDADEAEKDLNESESLAAEDYNDGHGAEEDIDETEGTAEGEDSSTPNAPRRGQSAYVMFSMDAREQVKVSLPPGSKVTDVMKGIAARWRDLSTEEKAVWEKKSIDDKDRYERELSMYEGPLKIANKRAKKDPSAPKRAMSAFLHFAQSMRPRLRNTYPDAKNMDMSKMLGEEWNRMTDEEKRPYQAKAASDSNRYKEAMAVWKRGGTPGE